MSIRASAAARRRSPGSRGAAVLLGLLGTGLVVLASTRPWAQVPVSGVPGLSRVTATGRASAPAAVAVALAAAAGCVVLGTAGRRIRQPVAGLLVFAGVGIASLVVQILTDPRQAVEPALTQATGLVADAAATRAATSTGWPWLAMAGAALVVAAGVIGVLRSGSWAGPSRRFEPDARQPADAGPAEDDRAAAALAWDALSRGEDPT